MDNLAHTLVGAALGRAVAGRELPAAGWIGAVAGNAPDWAELVLRPSSWTPRAGVDYLVYHRGITHAFLGAAVEIVALTGLVGLILRWWARRHGGNPAAWRSIAACVALTVASHLYLDWQGSYGLRPLLPWSGRWYYADWVAIVDPVFWLVPLVVLAWGARRHWAPALVYLLSLIGITTLVLWRGRELVAWGVRLATLGGAVAGVAGWTEHWFGVAGRRFGPAAAWAALTVIGHPFHWEKLAASRDSVAGSGWVAPRHLDDAAVRTALATPRGRAIAQFARFLVAAVDSSGGRLRVLLWDARFHPTAPGPGAWAAVAIPVR